MCKKHLDFGNFRNILHLTVDSVFRIKFHVCPYYLQHGFMGLYSSIVYWNSMSIRVFNGLVLLLILMLIVS